MSGAKERILEMLSSGTITAKEADELLAALHGPKEHGLDWLFQPMKRLKTEHALALAGGAAMLQLAVSRLQIRFDGALDMHTVRDAVPWSAAIGDLVLAWPITALLLFVVTWPIARQGRAVDFLAAVGVARIPLIASGALAAAFRDLLFVSAEGAHSVGSVAVVLAIVLLAVWHVALLVTGTRVVAGLRGGKLALAMVLGLVVAETLTKVALAYLA